MSDPTVITLDEGETEQIITKADAKRGLPYLVEVQNSPIRFAHEKANADRGAELSPGQTHTMSNLRNQPVYVTPRGGSAEIRVRPAGADVETQPPKGVTVEGDIQIGSEVTAIEPSYQSLYHDTVTGSGSFAGQIVPQGVDAIFRADPTNNDQMQIDGFPVEPGESAELAVDNVDVPNITANDSADVMHVLAEVA